MTKRNPIFSAMFAFLLVFSLCTPVFTRSPAQDPFDVSTWDITFVDSEDAVIPQDEFQALLSAVPELRHLPIVQQVSPDQSAVILTPEDIFAIYCCTDDPEVAAELQSTFAHSSLSIHYKDGIISLAMLPNVDHPVPYASGRI